jgi:ketosteroid isomerase-like protein
MSDSLAKERLAARISLLNEHLEAENRHDIDAIMATYEQEPEVVVNGKVFSGAGQIRRFHERLGFSTGGGFSELHVEERHRHTHDAAVVIEQTLSGKHTGTWQGLAPTGRPFAIPVCTVYTFGKQNKLACERVYFDSALLLTQLGAGA